VIDATPAGATAGCVIESAESNRPRGEGGKKKKRERKETEVVSNMRDVLNAALRQSENLLPGLKARANNPIYVLWPVALS